MNLYPAIDLYEGHAVRLEKGDFQKKTVYSETPAAVAQKWQDAGAEWIHVVDLEGAKTGILKNLPTLLEIRKSVRCKIQFGGGLRSLEVIDQVLQAGVDRAVVGTKALDEKFLNAALEKFDSRLAVGLDVKNGVVQTQGWLDSQNPTLETTLKLLNPFPVQTVIYTNIQKDGMLEGPDFDGLIQVLNTTRAHVILSGGVSTLEDLLKCARLKQTNFDGAIIGKALYEGRIDLREAVQRTKK